MPDLKTDRLDAVVSPGVEGARSVQRDAFREVLRRTVEGEVMPRLLMQLRSVPGGPAAKAYGARALPAGALRHFIELLRERDEASARQYIADLLVRGCTPEVVLRDLLTPAARRLGQLWEADECDFMEVTLICGRLQRSVSAMGRMNPSRHEGQDRGRALICGLPEDQHTLGGVVIAEMLTRDGWQVTLARPFAAGEPRGDYDLICFSLASSDRAEAAARSIRALRRRQRGAVHVLLGGSALLHHPELAQKIGADEWAREADDAVESARRVSAGDTNSDGAIPGVGR